jgi:preprotein translocase subunit SecD
VTDTAKQQVLFPAAERVIARKLASIDIKNARISVLHFGGDKATLTVGLKNMEQIEAADALVQEKLTFDIRVEESPASTTADAVWKDTGVTAKQLEWIQPLTNPTTSEVGVELQFTDEGKMLLSKAFADNAGKNIGIFVRGLLVSKMTISSTPLQSSHIIIGGIPSAKVAEIFSEDVNVGTHLTFTPVP